MQTSCRSTSRSTGPWSPCDSPAQKLAWPVFINKITALQTNNTNNQKLHSYFLENRHLADIYENSNTKQTDSLVRFIKGAWTNLNEIIVDREQAVNKAQKQRQICDKLYNEVDDLLEEEKTNLKLELEQQNEELLSEKTKRLRTLLVERDQIENALLELTNQSNLHQNACVNLDKANKMLVDTVDKLVNEREQLYYSALE